MIAEIGFTQGLRVSLTTRIAAVDYETYYKKKEYSVADMSYWGYCHDPRFDAYLVSIVTSDGLRWAGPPKDAPWDQIRDHVWLSWNRPFDFNVHLRLQEDGIVPRWDPIYWGNPANLAAYIRCPRALAKAVAAVYQREHSKKIRDKDLQDKHWHELPAALQKAAIDYALKDSDWCLKFWLDHIHLWPEKELRISDLIDNRGLRGVYIDRDGAERDKQILLKVIHEAAEKIPWRESGKMLSTKDLAMACRREGVPPPESLDMKSEKLAEWEDQYADQYPWVGAMRDYRRMNSILKKYEAIVERIKPDGRAEFTIRYMGTHTGRTAAGEKGGDQEGRKTFNMLNLPRSPFYVRKDWTIVHRKAELKEIESFLKKEKRLPDYIIHAIDLRAKIIPAPGYKFVIVDMSQIEARITNWLGHDEDTLALIRRGFSVYDAHAIRLMNYRPQQDETGRAIPLKKADPGLYALAKARELALGFQAGHVRFIAMAPNYISDEECAAIFGAPITPSQEEWYKDTLQSDEQKHYLTEYDKLPREIQIARVNSQRQVKEFRRNKRWLPQLWWSLGEDLEKSVKRGETHEIELPSGRILEYFDVKQDEFGIHGRVERDGPTKILYGGKLLENTVQATARDIFCDGQLKLHEAGIWVILDVYDENVTEVPLDFNGQLVADIMTTNPAWATTLPLGAEVEESMYYKK